jgi:hypothetical protein
MPPTEAEAMVLFPARFLGRKRSPAYVKAYLLYLTSDPPMTLRAIAKKVGMAGSTIRLYSSRDGWVEKREQVWAPYRAQSARRESALNADHNPRVQPADSPNEISAPTNPPPTPLSPDEINTLLRRQATMAENAVDLDPDGDWSSIGRRSADPVMRMPRLSRHPLNTGLSLRDLIRRHGR